MTVFDHEFRNLPPELLEQLGTLQHEGAVYSQMCLGDTEEFCWYRIALRPEEIAAYVRGARAFDEFIGHLQEVGEAAAALERIRDAGVREIVKSYLEVVEDGYCLFAFVGDAVEDLLCVGQPERCELCFN